MVSPTDTGPRPNPLWTGERSEDQPVLGIGPIRAVRRYWSKGFTFQGRSSRSEFWWWWLVNVVITVALQFAVGSISGSSPAIDVRSGLLGPAIAPVITVVTISGASDSTSAWNLLLVAWALATLVPNLSIAVRRIHDLGRSGWIVLLALVPIASFVVFVMAMFPSREGRARVARFA